MYNIGGKEDEDNYKKIIKYATNNVVRNEREKKGWIRQKEKATASSSLEIETLNASALVEGILSDLSKHFLSLLCGIFTLSEKIFQRNNLFLLL